MNKYSWNFDDGAEVWNNDTFDTIEECFLDAKWFDDDNHNVVYIGENIPYIPTVDVEHILCDLEEQASEQCGEVGDYWVAYDPNKKQELEELQENIDKVVHGWLKKYNRYPDIGSIKNIKDYLLD